jgi:hypothetical protein
MKFLKFGIVIAFCALIAGLSFAASTPREVADRLIIREASNEVVLVTFNGTLDADDECLYVEGLDETTGAAVATVACDNVLLNQFSVPAAFEVTKIVTTVVVAGDAGYGCIVNADVDGTNAGVAQTLATDAAAQSVTSTPQLSSLTLAAGDLLGIQVLDGAGALVCAGTIDPSFQVSVFGRFTE